MLIQRLTGVVRGCRGLQLAVLFGSFAKGRAHRDSDVDVAVMLDPDVALAEELALQESLARATGRDVDLVRLEHADTILRNRVAREGVLVFERTPGTFSRYSAIAALEYLDLEPALTDARKRFLRRLAGSQ